MRRARWLTGLVALLGAAACDGDSHAPLINRCSQTFECARDSEKCDPQLNICVASEATRPYTIALLIVPNDPALVRTSTPQLLFNGIDRLDAVKIRRSVTVTGSVVDSQGRPVSAEVAFIPQAESYLASGVSAFTQLVSLPDAGIEAASTYAYRAALNPVTDYDVQVFPLGNDSLLLPPATFELLMSEAVSAKNFAYPSMTLRSAIVLDESKKPPPPGSKLRLRNRTSQLYVSSIGKPDPTTGRFQLYAPMDVLSASTIDQYELVLEVPFGDDPSSVEIVFEASAFKSEATLVMPTVPVPVTYAFSVGPEDQPLRVSADVTFVSGFALPSQTGNVRSRDWCKLRLPGAIQGTFRCSTRVKTSAIAPLAQVKLLPGDYQLYFVPNGDVQDGVRLATSNQQESISDLGDGGVQSGRMWALPPAVLYPGHVVNTVGAAMPGVTVSADALGVQQLLPPLASFNRTSEQVSDGKGRFEVAVDTGFYDLVATQPDNSTGFPWMLRYYNRSIDQTPGNTPNPDLPVQVATPVLARGTVFADGPPDGGSAYALGQARIEAFAIVPNVETGTDRAVRIARTQSDDRGNFALMLPPYIGDPPVGTSSSDAGVTSSRLDSTADDLDGGLDSGL